MACGTTEKLRVTLRTVGGSDQELEMSPQTSGLLLKKDRGADRESRMSPDLRAPGKGGVGGGPGMWQDVCRGTAGGQDYETLASRARPRCREVWVPFFLPEGDWLSSLSSRRSPSSGACRRRASGCSSACASSKAQSRWPRSASGRSPGKVSRAVFPHPFRDELPPGIYSIDPVGSLHVCFLEACEADLVLSAPRRRSPLESQSPALFCQRRSLSLGSHCFLGSALMTSKLSIPRVVCSVLFAMSFHLPFRILQHDEFPR